MDLIHLCASTLHCLDPEGLLTQSSPEGGETSQASSASMGIHRNWKHPASQAESSVAEGEYMAVCTSTVYSNTVCVCVCACACVRVRVCVHVCVLDVA